MKEDEPSLLPSRTWVPAALSLAAVFLLLSLGRSVSWNGTRLLPGPFGFLYDHVALFQRLRIPERLSLLVMLFVGLLAARGLMLVPWRGLRLALCVFLPLEHLSILQTWVSLPTRDEVPPVYRFLATDAARAVAETPIHGEGLVRMESLDMYYALYHHKPIVAAYLSFPPLLTALLRRSVAEFPSRETLDTLRRVGVDTVLLHEGRDGGQAMARAAREEPAQSELRRVATFPNTASVLTERGIDLGDRGVDTVYRIEPRPLEVAAPFPSGSRVRDAAWVYRSSAGPAGALGDADLDTSWKSEDPIRGGELVEVLFRRQIVAVSGLALPMNRLQVLPSLFVVEGRTEDGQWQELTRFGPAHRRQLINSLLVSPGRARLGLAFDRGPHRLSGVRLRALPGARSFDGWRLSELEVLTTDAAVR